MYGEFDRIIFDTSALIDYFEGKFGEEVEGLISKSESVSIPSVVIAEFTSKIRRKGFEPDQFISKLEMFSAVLPLDLDMAKKAGELHFEKRKTIRDISLIDCIVMAHADETGAAIIATDSHFSNYRNSRILG